MSKLQKFYGALSESQKCAAASLNPSASIDICEFTPSSAAGRAARSGSAEDNLESVLAAMHDEAEVHLAELKVKIRTAIQHKKQTACEVTHLKNHLGILRQRLHQTHPAPPGDLEALFNRIEKHLAVLCRLYSDDGHPPGYGG